MIFQERTYAVLLVSAAQSFNNSIMNLLPMTDYWPLNTVDSVAAARRALLERSSARTKSPSAAGMRISWERFWVDQEI